MGRRPDSQVEATAAASQAGCAYGKTCCVRLWTLHPKYLDPPGLVALWRESLLAQKVLKGETRGYRSHPQLIRFQAQPSPVAAIATYLRPIYDEAVQRGYRFDPSKIEPGLIAPPLVATSGQLLYEWAHLKRKLSRRAPERLPALTLIALPELHPLFRLIEGGVETWERFD